MKTKLTFFIVAFLLNSILFSHTVNYQNVILRHWDIVKEHKTVEGSFSMCKNGNVYIEDANNKLIHFPLLSLSKKDQLFVNQKNEMIHILNTGLVSNSDIPTNIKSLFDIKFWIVSLLLITSGLLIYLIADKKKKKYLFSILSVGVIMSLFGFTKKTIRLLQSTTSPTFIDSAFAPFRPQVNTFWDATYFYVESKGIPSHQMMVGISNHGWQQQVPIPQCYIGSNAWLIPLNPIISSNPIPVDSIHFTRGAIAIAANGVAIFNVHTNTGVDSYIDGQLDNFGGHCGRADDYHYHIAPLFLDNQTADILPIAFALDGFAVYGSLEPDGSAMVALDANHGHFGTDGVYHYHGTVSAPYMIANMAGQVTEDATHQIIPQAAAHPVRPSLTPLNGALITGCIPNSTNNGYKLIYTLNGQTDSIVYSWTSTGSYTFKYYTPTLTTTNYNGFTQCSVPTVIKEINSEDNSVLIYPNPSNETFSIRLSKGVNEKDVKGISIYNMIGELVYYSEYTKQNFDIRNLTQGNYFIKIQFERNQITKKLIVK